MDAESALLDDAQQLVDADLPRVVHFQRAARSEATVEDREHEGLEKVPVGVIERAVEEDVGRVVARAPRRQGAGLALT